MQSSGKKEVTGANVLVAIFGEKDSHAVYFLNQQDVTRLDVVNYISHGIAKQGERRAAGHEDGARAEGGEGEGKGDAAGRIRQQPQRARAWPARSTR